MLSKRIRKKGPFDLSMITPQYPYFSQLLAIAINQIKELPDFFDDDKIAVMSDFGGEHKGARFNTYTFLLYAQSKIGVFELEVKKLREKYGILNPYSEFSYKDLKYGPRSRALPDFLKLVDSFIHGALITVAIDRGIDTVFGVSKQDTFPLIEKQLEDLGYGGWQGDVAEKALRICHSIALFTALCSREKQRFLWYCDLDAINEDGNHRGFADTQRLFAHILGMYARHEYELIGFAKSFKDKSYLDDLLSIADFGAGIVQDIMKWHKSGSETMPGGDEKELILKWISNQGRFLSKITVEITKLSNGKIGSRIIEFNPVSGPSDTKE